MLASIFQRTKTLTQLLPTVGPNLIPVAPSLIPARFYGDRPPLPKTREYFSSKPKVRHIRRKYSLKKKPELRIPVEENNAKPMQDWWDWDGIGQYKSRRHGYPVNMMLRDVQKRRSFEKHNEERTLINAVWKNDFLPQELKDLAYQEIQKHPRDSTVLRINRRCTVTGRARGIFHQFRVSRFIFRHNADYNKISGAQYAIWMKGIDIKP